MLPNDGVDPDRLRYLDTPNPPIGAETARKGSENTVGKR